MKNTEIIIPGSKSYTNRALFAAALTKGTVRIHNPLLSDDTKAMISCLEILGIAVDQKNNVLEIKDDISSITDREYKLDADLSGLAIRFMLALATIIPGEKIITGKEGLNKRPIADLVDALRQLGADIIYLEKEGFPPLRVNSAQLTNHTVTVNGSVSSQFLSALLMIAPVVGGLTIEVTGEQISKPYIAMTIDLMKQFGVSVASKDKTFVVFSKEKYVARDYTVEGDVSSASYFFAIAALTKTTLTLKNLNPKSKQADMEFLKILEYMGNKIICTDDEMTIVGKGIRPIEVDMQSCPDQAQTLAVLAAFAKGTTKISGIKSLRVKETERIAALQKELTKMGIKTESTEDSLTIQGGNPKSAVIDTYGDHRMAMAFAIAKTQLPDMVINNPEVVNKTFPDFWKELVRLENPTKTNIVLIGMRGSGKTTIGKLLAKKYQKHFVDLDEVLEKKLNLKVSEIVEKFGWDYFRDQESFVAKETSLTNAVIATGGGVILREENIDALKQDGVSIQLYAEPKILAERIGEDSSRPALTKGFAKDELEQILKEREELYLKYADFVIRTDTIDPVSVVDEITKKLKKTFPSTIKICMVIGDPIAHSLSPQMHKAGYEALGLTDQFTYLAKKVSSENLKDFVTEVKTNGIRGVSITVPHKEAVIPYLDEIDSVAQKIGAVNTIVNTDGVLKGYNTDYLGVTMPLEKITTIEKKRVLILGAGGAARAAIFAVTQKKAKVFIYNRTLEKATSLAKEFGAEVLQEETLDEIKNMDIIINTTSVGLHDQKETPLPKKYITAKQIVFDLVYAKEVTTRLLLDAQEQGAMIISGKEMLLYQGLMQFFLFTGHEAPVAIMRKAIT